MKGNRIQGTLRSYLRWPLLLSPLLLAMNIHIYTMSIKAGGSDDRICSSLYYISILAILLYNAGSFFGTSYSTPFVLIRPLSGWQAIWRFPL